MASRNALLAGYLYPAFLAALAVVAAVLGFGHRAGLFRPTSRFAVRPLDAEPFYALELLAFVACAILAYRVVARLRAGRSVTALRVYWPIVLALLGLLSVALYGLSLEDRGCGNSALDPRYSCWEPRATYLRVAFVSLVTAIFLFLLARFAAAKAPSAEPRKPKRPKDSARPEASGAEGAEAVEEIPAR